MKLSKIFERIIRKMLNQVDIIYFTFFQDYNINVSKRIFQKDFPKI